MGMRQQFTKTMAELMAHDEQVVTILNDIGVFAFRNIKKEYPTRIYNLGILEQSSIGIAAGLSLAGMVPVFHTIAPFIVERGYEQLKDDFGYQCINGNFVSVGGSYDYSQLGTTHYCPGDVGALLQIPNIQIVLPGSEDEFDTILKAEYRNGFPTYFRLSEYSNEHKMKISLGKANILKHGNRATVIAVGTMLDRVIDAVSDLDVSLLYYSTVRPFDYTTLVEATSSHNIVICEPYYSGAITHDVIEAFDGQSVRICHIGIPHELLTTYGTVQEIDKHYELDSKSIKSRIEAFLGGRN